MNEVVHRAALPSGTRVQDFEFHRVLGHGGFGLTYLGWHHALDIPVAIKEYLPSDLAVRTSDLSVAPKSTRDEADFQWGLERFIDEARTLARFAHPNVVRIYHYFQAHGTGYIVMEYAEGETLADLLDRRGTLSEGELERVLQPVLSGLELVHGASFLHRDIKPGNIVIRADGTPVLIDFGAARQAVGAKSRSLTSIVTPGYAPIEQYETRGRQGPWTDIYALAAVCYRALTGEVPADSTERVRRDPLVPALDKAAGRARSELLRAIDWALTVNEDERPQSVAAWRDAFAPGRATSSAAPPPSSRASPEGERHETPVGGGAGEVPREVPPASEQRGVRDAITRWRKAVERLPDAGRFVLAVTTGSILWAAIFISAGSALTAEPLDLPTISVTWGLALVLTAALGALAYYAPLLRTPPRTLLVFAAGASFGVPSFFGWLEGDSLGDGLSEFWSDPVAVPFVLSAAVTGLWVGWFAALPRKRTAGGGGDARPAAVARWPVLKSLALIAWGTFAWMSVAAVVSAGRCLALSSASICGDVVAAQLSSPGVWVIRLLLTAALVELARRVGRVRTVGRIAFLFAAAVFVWGRAMDLNLAIVYFGGDAGWIAQEFVRSLFSPGAIIEAALVGGAAGVGVRWLLLRRVPAVAEPRREEHAT